MLRPCLDCSRPFQPLGSIRSRCPECHRRKARARSQARGTKAERGYGADYRRKRAEILASNPLCSYCTRPADTVDHVPPLAVLRAHGLPLDGAQLLPACRECNSSRGGQLNKGRGR